MLTLNRPTLTLKWVGLRTQVDSQAFRTLSNGQKHTAWGRVHDSAELTLEVTGKRLREVEHTTGRYVRARTEPSNTASSSDGPIAPASSSDGTIAPASASAEPAPEPAITERRARAREEPLEPEGVVDWSSGGLPAWHLWMEGQPEVLVSIIIMY